MYQGKIKLMNPQKHEETRKDCVSYRGGAIYTAFTELDGIVCKSEFAKQYMEKSVSWFSQKLNGCPVGGVKRGFTADEARRIAGSFRDIARRLEALSEEIDAVADID